LVVTAGPQDERKRASVKGAKIKGEEHEPNTNASRRVHRNGFGCHSRTGGPLQHRWHVSKPGRRIGSNSRSYRPDHRYGTTHRSASTHEQDEQRYRKRRRIFGRCTKANARTTPSAAAGPRRPTLSEDGRSRLLASVAQKHCDNGRQFQAAVCS